MRRLFGYEHIDAVIGTAEVEQAIRGLIAAQVDPLASIPVKDRKVAKFHSFRNKEADDHAAALRLTYICPALRMVRNGGQKLAYNIQVP
jgi:hypothetical protein